MRYAPLTTRIDAFIDAATTKHDGKYDYSHVPAEFVNAHTKVTIGCPDHGDFTQTPNDHKRGQRCPDCSGRRGSKPLARREQFIARAQELHGDRYDYTKVVYVNQHTPVTIVCRRHGPFDQRPTNHLATGTPHNCHDCADKERVLSLTDAWKHREQQARKKRSGKFKKAA